MCFVTPLAVFPHGMTSLSSKRGKKASVKVPTSVDGTSMEVDLPMCTPFVVCFPTVCLFYQPIPVIVRRRTRASTITSPKMDLMPHCEWCSVCASISLYTCFSDPLESWKAEAKLKIHRWKWNSKKSRTKHVRCLKRNLRIKRVHLRLRAFLLHFTHLCFDFLLQSGFNQKEN